MKLIGILLLSLTPILSFAATEDNLKIIEVGAWADGNSIFYVRFDRAVGPSSCNSDFAKVYLGDETSSEKQLMAMSTIRAMALTALTTGLDVKINTLDTCVHNSPSFSQLYIKS